MNSSSEQTEELEEVEELEDSSVKEGCEYDIMLSSSVSRRRLLVG